MQKSKSKLVKPNYLEQRRKFVKMVYDDWTVNNGLSLVSICEKHNITEGTIRAWMRTNKVKRPDGIDGSVQSDRQKWIIEGYNQGLELDLTAKQCSIWASDKGKCYIGRGDIQYYANKFNLPLLRETEGGIHLSKTSKYG